MCLDFSPGDRLGSVVWCGANFTHEETFEVRRQTYKGEPVLTLWQGKLILGHGEGSYYILNQNYEVIKHMSAIGHDEMSDLHEFYITDDDTALVTIYNKRPYNLTDIGGPAEGWIYEGQFQEIDIETGKMLFQWNASDHFNVSESRCLFGKYGQYGTNKQPYDFYHINAIQKDPEGNYLVSGKMYDGVYKVNGQTGDLIWKLNGPGSDFEVASNASFRMQHHARWLDPADQTYMTIFDNRDISEHTSSRGILLKVDQEAKTVTLVREFRNMAQTWSQFEGSVSCFECDKPDETNWMVGWGFQPFFTEFSANGTILLDAQWGLDKSVNSYRTYKDANWIGKPKTKPNVMYHGDDGIVYVSWNGATEVETWEVWVLESHNYTITPEHREDNTANQTDATDSSSLSSRQPQVRTDPDKWVPLDPLTTRRTGFETTIDITRAFFSIDEVPASVVLRALDKQGKELGVSEVAQAERVRRPDDVFEDEGGTKAKLEKRLES